ncbi:MAG: transglycosylase domain-containing protein [Chitinophagaceae bacterium]
MMKFLVRDYAKFITRRTLSRNFPKNFIDFGEHFSTWFFVFLIAISGFLLYKFATVLVAYFLSGDLIQFFIILRNVFTIKSASQTPFLMQHTLAGLILFPLTQFVACYVIFRSIKSFMLFINNQYKTHVYSESDLLYFSFFGVLIFMFADIVSFSQDIPGASAFAHFIYLAVSRLACICYLLTIAHVNLLSSNQYKQSLPLYFTLRRLETNIVLSSWKSILLTYVIGIILNVPMFLGTQFLENNLYVIIICFLSSLLFYFILRTFLAKGYNYLGAVLFHHRLNVESFLIDKETMRPQVKSYLLIGAGIAILCFGVLHPKILFFICFLFLLLVVFILILFSIGYFVFLGISVLRARKIDADVPDIFMPGVNYLRSAVLAFGSSIFPAFVFIIFVTILLSVSPKKYPYKLDKDYVTSVSDSDGFPLHIKYNGGNSAIPVPYAQLPPFLVKCVLNQEDRGFLEQNSWVPNLANWHGVSLASLYRSFTGTGGGSNLNMQTIKNLAFSGSFPADIQRKFSETITSFQLSLQLTPEQIATQYFNKVAWNGGNTHSGINMGSLYTFGVPVQQLNELQILYLVKTLRRGSFFKAGDSLVNYRDAGRSTAGIKKELVNYATTMFENGVFSKKELNNLKNQELGFVNSRFDVPCQTSTKDFLNKQMDKKDTTCKTYQSSITFTNQQAMAMAVNEFNREFNQYLQVGENSLFTSAIVIDIHSGKILGHYGSGGVTDLTTMGSGRNMGSLMKPFVYCELLESGFNADNIRFFDGPISGLKTPKDFGAYSYRYLTIDDALAQSRNACAVNVRLLTDPIALFKNVENRFRQMNIPVDPYLSLSDEKLRTVNILNYPIGSRNMTLLNIAQAYQVLFNKGQFIKLSAFNNYYDPYQDTIVTIYQNRLQIYNPKNADRIKNALHHTMLSGGTTFQLNQILTTKRTMYAKTGTTDDAKDGLCVLTDGNILVVSHVSYGQINNDHLRLGTIPIPFGAAGRSAGVFSAIIFNHFSIPNE